jgi:site-specific recombinase XerD
MATLWKRPNGIWYTLDGDSMRSLKTRDRAVAKRVIQELQSRKLAHLRAPKSWAIFVLDYHASRQGLSPMTCKCDRLALNHFSRWMGSSDFPLARITVKRLDEYRAWLAAEFKNSNTRNVYLRSLKTALKRAVRWDLLDVSLSGLTQYRVDPSQPAYMTPAEVRALLLASAKVPGMATVIPIMVYCGISRAEIMGPINYTGDALQYRRQKTGKLITVPVSSHLAPYLADLSPGIQRLTPWSNPRTLSAAFSKVCKVAKVSTSPHKVRHTFATMALSQGLPLAVISEVLGHSQIAITKRFYAHVEKETVRAALENFRL